MREKAKQEKNNRSEGGLGTVLLDFAGHVA
jgi:hypothetical protein